MWCLREVFRAVLLAGLLVWPTALRAEPVTIYRDTWGVPNIYAQTEEGGCFAMGYAQAEDRPEQIFANYRRAIGSYAEVAGPGEVFSDFRARVWKHAEISKKNYRKVSAKVRACLEAYQAGIKQYFEENPGKKPAMAIALEPWMCVALGRAVIWGWPEGQAGGDLIRGGVRPEPVKYRGSNQMALAGSKTAAGVPVAVIDPHLGFYGMMRFYEARVYAGKIQVAGTAVVGLPFISLGHNEYVSVAMTTGGPDTADVFIETINPDNPAQYKYDGKWRDGRIETIRVPVKTKSGKIDHVERKVLYTHHGPAIYEKEGKGYAMALSYFNEVGLADQTYKLLLAKNIRDVKTVLAMAQLMPQNVMVACVDGDIYYQRAGRVPIRPQGYDYNLPVPGDTSKTEWKGIHPTKDLVQILNPKVGWMQNCNVSPRVMFRDSPLTEDKYKSYLYMEPEAMGIKYGLHQRAAMTFRQLDQVSKATVEDVLGIALSAQVYGVKPWQDRLRTAWESVDEEVKKDKKLKGFADAILNWNGRAEEGSTGILCYYYWKQQQSEMVRVYSRLGSPPPNKLVLPDKKVIETLKAGYEAMMAEHGSVDVKYGDVYRVGRRGGKRTAPAVGGGVTGIATPRALGFGKKNEKGHHLMGGGQCAFQVVELSRPPKSWTIAPLGQSDDPSSPHFDDQAVELVSKRKPKSTYFKDKQTLLKNLESKKVLTYRG